MHSTAVLPRPPAGGHILLLHFISPGGHHVRMWCERVVRNLSDDTPPVGVDFVDVEWNECGRVLKKRSRNGQQVRVLLPLGQKLRHGDVLHEVDGQLVVLNVRPCEVIVARPATWRDAAILAMELGNLHRPAQVLPDAILFEEVPMILEILREQKIPWDRQTRRFTPETMRAGPDFKLAETFLLIRESGDQTLEFESARRRKSNP